MRTGRDIEAWRRRLVDAKAECDHQRASGSDEVFAQAYVAVKAIELRLAEMLRENNLRESMMEVQTFRFERYDLVCSAPSCDNGMFRAALVISRNIWPSRPRTIAVRGDRHPTADVAIESAHAQGLEWVRNFG